MSICIYIFTEIQKGGREAPWNPYFQGGGKLVNFLS